MNVFENIDCAVFDLDGTLMSSHETIYQTMMHTFRLMNIEAAIPQEAFNKTIGHHFKDIFDEFKISVPDVEEFIAKYKSFYFDYLELSKVYSGAEDLLKNLNGSGFKVALLTTKAQDQADKIIDNFGMRKYFNYVMGRQVNIPIKPEPDMMFHICKELGVKPERALMIGDSELDILCGKNAGTKTCAVTFGYRSKEELEKLTPDYMISDYHELLDYFMKAE